MAKICGAIQAEIKAFDCARMTTHEASGRMVIVNFDDYVNADITRENGIISAVELPATKTGYLYRGATGMVATGWGIEGGGTLDSHFVHNITAAVRMRTSENINTFSQMKDGKFAVLVEMENWGDDDKSRYLWFGDNNGLRLMNASKGEGTTFVSLELAGGDSGFEAALPTPFFATDKMATVAMFEALYDAAEAA